MINEFLKNETKILHFVLLMRADEPVKGALIYLLEFVGKLLPLGFRRTVQCGGSQFDTLLRIVKEVLIFLCDLRNFNQSFIQVFQFLNMLLCTSIEKMTEPSTNLISTSRSTVPAVSKETWEMAYLL